LSAKEEDTKVLCFNKVESRAQGVRTAACCDLQINNGSPWQSRFATSFELRPASVFTQTTVRLVQSRFAT
jgi:hypothetical protein